MLAPFHIVIDHFQILPSKIHLTLLYNGSIPAVTYRVFSVAIAVHTHFTLFIEGSRHSNKNFRYFNSTNTYAVDPYLRRTRCTVNAHHTYTRFIESKNENAKIVSTLLFVHCMCSQLIVRRILSWPTVVCSVDMCKRQNAIYDKSRCIWPIAKYDSDMCSNNDDFPQNTNPIDTFLFVVFLCVRRLARFALALLFCHTTNDISIVF